MTPPADVIRKRFYPIKRREGLSFTDMMAYWTTSHAALVASTPGIQEGYSTYVQNHLTEPGPRGDAFPFDGVTMLALRANKPLFVSPSDREKIKADERKVFDTAASVGLTAIENVVIAGTGACKLMIFSRRLPGLSSEAYSEHWRTRHVEVILNQSDFCSQIRGYIQNHVVPGSAGYLNGGLIDYGIFDGVIEMWFDSIDEARSAFNSDGYQRFVRADEASFIHVGHSISHFVQEMTVF